MSDGTRSYWFPFFHIVGTIDWSCLASFQHWAMAYCYQSGQRLLHLVITSPGGLLDAGLAFLDLLGHLRTEGIKVEGHVFGQAYSMAAIILQGCDYRTMGAYASLGLHGWTAMQQGDKRAWQIAAKQTAYQEGLLRELLQRRTHLSEAELDDILGGEYMVYYNPQQALEKGLVDMVRPGSFLGDGYILQGGGASFMAGAEQLSMSFERVPDRRQLALMEGA